jgi:hypothetical protein
VKRAILKRFWAKVDFHGRCWVWLGSRTYNGYGEFRITHTHKILAHVFTYRLFCGAKPKGMDVCHRCDNPSCVRPSHLWIGTRSDNMRDAAKKGRICGNNHWTSKLTSQELKQIFGKKQEEAAK